MKHLYNNHLITKIQAILKKIIHNQRKIKILEYLIDINLILINKSLFKNLKKMLNLMNFGKNNYMFQAIKFIWIKIKILNWILISVQKLIWLQPRGLQILLIMYHLQEFIIASTNLLILHTSTLIKIFIK